MQQQAESDLRALLAGMTPVLNPGRYVFCTSKDAALVPLEKTVGFFRESEGVTFILEEAAALGLGLEYSYVAAWISLTVHSSLAAVGLTAAFSAALAARGISCNVVAAYYHDHIFVDYAEAQQAMAVLAELSEQAGRPGL